MGEVQPLGIGSACAKCAGSKTGPLPGKSLPRQRARPFLGTDHATSRRATPRQGSFSPWACHTEKSVPLGPCSCCSCWARRFGGWARDGGRSTEYAVHTVRSRRTSYCVLRTSSCVLNTAPPGRTAIVEISTFVDQKTEHRRAHPCAYLTMRKALMARHRARHGPRNPGRRAGFDPYFRARNRPLCLPESGDRSLCPTGMTLSATTRLTWLSTYGSRLPELP